MDISYVKWWNQVWQSRKFSERKSVRDMKEKVVLFGTGDDLKKCLGILREQGIEPYLFYR